ncbi:MAG: hypothetical protein MZV49_13005 [Rhodopseudomonas palustris]|nr:hypothetical protein [Rhodopseudomonas palustris]
MVGIAAAAIIASSQHDDHHNKNHNNNYNNSNYNNNYDNRYDGRYDSRYNDNYRNYDNSRYGYNGYGGDPRRTFTCESRNDRRNYCSIPRARTCRDLQAAQLKSPQAWSLVGRGRQQRVGC